MVARSQVQVSLVIREARCNGSPCLDASIDTRVHPLGNHVDERACISIAGRRNIIVFHPHDFISGNALQVNV